MSDLRAPFPYFGRKGIITDLVWKRFGDLHTYVEPFCGSCAMLLGNPNGKANNEIINDANGLVVNFWRAVKFEPESVKEHAKWPDSELDLHARSKITNEKRDELVENLRSDPKYYDPELAGWYAWGESASIGDSYEEGKHSKPQIFKGCGVNAKSFDLDKEFEKLFERMVSVRILCGDWKRCFTEAMLKNTSFHPVGIFLDPPYLENEAIYSENSQGIASEVEGWCKEHGDKKDVRIVLCGYEGDYDLPDTWNKIAWKAQGGYRNRQDEGTSRTDERLWFSPECLEPNQRAEFLEDMFDI